jgi:hypothetical protein
MTVGHLDAAHHDGATNGAGGPAREVLHASLRGAVAAAAMTGARAFTVNAGLVKEPPPRAIVDKKAPLFRLVPRKKRRAAVELLHWGYGAQGGAMFGVLPEGVRRRAWSGPVYGLVLWLGFELVIAPALGLKHAKRPRPAERLALAADHALYGFVLSEMRRRPQA